MAALGTFLRSVRRLHCSAAARAGSKWRLQQGLAANPSGYGPLTEHPDWSYAETRRPAVTGNGCCSAGMAVQTAGDAAGRRKEAGKRPQTQRESTSEPPATPVKKQPLAFSATTFSRAAESPHCSLSVFRAEGLGYWEERTMRSLPVRAGSVPAPLLHSSLALRYCLPPSPAVGLAGL
ncbi:39S ribosomal protein L52, mitochondrial isoform X2 [Sorex araneus]|uniref:39S ribosomal protein L52, mitochondrial isoform X2 n=1 Tax=Sorex araneus TaxID=42254 RepID=UPI002433C669|nr:39S ribosomal protein L52, mitochondrial isoform X2 [Sorex araneus]